MKSFKLFFVVVFLLTGLCKAENPPCPADKALTLSPTENNPRNSEGDFVRLSDGKILFVYTRYTGKSTNDHAPASLAAIVSPDNGKTWGSPRVIVQRPDNGLNIMSVTVLKLNDGRIALFYLDKHSANDCRPVVRYSSDDGESWSEPEHCITDQIGYYVINNSRVIQLKSGVILIPVALHNVSGVRFNGNARIFCYYSADNGKSWTRSGEAVNPNKVVFQEPGLVQLSSGKLLMYIRANDGCQHISWSSDDGKSWTPAEKSNFVSPLSPMSIRPIPDSDKLIAVWNENKNQRDPLTVAVVSEELEFLSKYTLDTSTSDTARWFCYPAILPLGKNQYLISYCAGEKKNWGLDTTRIAIATVE